MAELLVNEEELRSLFVENLGVIDQTDFERAAKLAKRLRVPLMHTLVEQGRIPQVFLLDQLAHSWNVSFVDLKIGQVKSDAINLLRETFARKQVLIPFEREGTQLHMAMMDPRELKVVNEVERLTGLRVRPFLATEAAIKRASSYIGKNCEKFSIERRRTRPLT